jgi:hypothetical protein
MTPSEEPGDTPTSLATITPRTSPTNLLSIPPELILDIFQEVGISSTSSQDLTSLATSSRRLYAHFKQNEYVILRRIITSLLLPPASSPPTLTTTDTMIKLAIAHSQRPWPLSPKAITKALLDAGDATIPIKVSPSMYGSILHYVRSTVAGRRGQRTAVPRERFWGLMTYVGYLGLGLPSDAVLRHPFDEFDPIRGVWKLGQDWNAGEACSSYEEMVSWAVEGYEKHAKEPVSDRERRIGELEGWVPCCLMERCPRFEKWEDGAEGKDGVEGGDAASG